VTTDPAPDWAPLELTVPIDLFKTEVRAWARRIGVAPRAIHVRPMSRKWASCSSNGRLTFSADLLRQPAAFRAEVCIHELLHLKVPNHGRLFRALLRAHLAAAYPDAEPDHPPRES
jgi:predicted metal-dependent hydrolase